MDGDDEPSSSPPPAQKQPSKAIHKGITTVPSLPEVDDEEAESSPAAAANAQPTKPQRKKGIAIKPRVPEKRGSKPTKAKSKQKEPRDHLNTRRRKEIATSPSVIDHPELDGAETQGKQKEPDDLPQTWDHDPEKEWKARGIVEENRRAYKIAWKGYDKQGKEWDHTWELISKVNKLARDDWDERKEDESRWLDIDPNSAGEEEDVDEPAEQVEEE